MCAGGNCTPYGAMGCWIAICAGRQHLCTSTQIRKSLGFDFWTHRGQNGIRLMRNPRYGLAHAADGHDPAYVGTHVKGGPLQPIVPIAAHPVVGIKGCLHFGPNGVYILEFQVTACVDASWRQGAQVRHAEQLPPWVPWVCENE